MATSRAILDDVSAYSRLWRITTALLVAISRIGALAMVAALLFLETRLDNPLRLLRTYVLASLVPEVAAWVLARAFAARVAVEPTQLVVRRRDRQIEVPCDAIVAVEPWAIPLPGTGVALRLRSGRYLPVELQTAQTMELVDALVDAGARDEVRNTARHPMAAYGQTSRAPVRWYHWLLQFPLFALVPTLPVFRLHQWITFGDTFGEYYTYGLQAYLLAFLMQWWTYTIHLLLYAAVLRTVAELAVLGAAWIAPARVAAVRRIAERGYWLLYLSGVPAFLVRLAIVTA